MALAKNIGLAFLKNFQGPNSLAFFCSVMSDEEKKV
jgi:hypothetical protein